MGDGKAFGFIEASRRQVPVQQLKFDLGSGRRDRVPDERPPDAAPIKRGLDIEPRQFPVAECNEPAHDAIDLGNTDRAVEQALVPIGFFKAEKGVDTDAQTQFIKARRIMNGTESWPVNGTVDAQRDLWRQAGQGIGLLSNMPQRAPEER